MVKEYFYYRMVFYSPKREKDRAKVLKKVVGIVNDMKMPYYFNLPNGSYEIQFTGDKGIIQEDLYDEKTGENIGKIEMTNKEYFENSVGQMKKHMESQFISESDYQKMSATEKYNHLKKMIESFVLENEEKKVYK